MEGKRGYLELGGTENTVTEAEKTKDRLISLALGTWDYLKNSGKYKTENWDLDFLGFLPAKRESRRMCGEYMISQRDISDDVVFPDTVAFGGGCQPQACLSRRRGREGQSPSPDGSFKLGQHGHYQFDRL